ncbi:translation initiation factor IF-3 [Spirochaetota bacterium]|nr:translation initiation factor IF-3 [Spirochaetota bacterium]
MRNNSRQRHINPRHANSDKGKFRINADIKASEVRLIDEAGSVLGTYPIKDALIKARDQELDLVEISPHHKPPICKIFNYNKFIYQREKKRKEAKRHQKTVQLKEIKFRPQTDVHDYNFKVKHIKEFLEHGDKVKVTIRFKGRELAFKGLGYDKIMQITEDIKELGKVEIPAKMEGRTLFMIVGPLRSLVREGKEPIKDETTRPDEESSYSKRVKRRLAENKESAPTTTLNTPNTSSSSPYQGRNTHSRPSKRPVLANRIGTIIKANEKNTKKKPT